MRIVLARCAACATIARNSCRASSSAILLPGPRGSSKVCLVADLVQEFDPGQFAIGVAGPVEQVDFQQGRPSRSTAGRVPRLATPGSARPSPAMPWTSTTNTPHSAGRPCGKRRFKRRKAEFAAEPAAVDDAPAEPVRPAEEVGRPARNPPAASASRTSELEIRLPASITVGMAQHLHPERRTHRCSRAKSPPRRAPKRKSSPMSRRRVCRPCARISVTKSCAERGGQRLVEVRDADPVDLQFGQRFELVAQVRDAHRFVLAGGEVLARMRLERQHAADQPVAPRVSHETADQRLVAAMDAIEVADGQGARLGACRAGGGGGTLSQRDYKERRLAGPAGASTRVRREPAARMPRVPLLPAGCPLLTFRRCRPGRPAPRL